MSKKARVFIVGLDGATFDLILPCMHGNKVKASSTRIYTLALSARIMTFMLNKKGGSCEGKKVTAGAII